MTKTTNHDKQNKRQKTKNTEGDVEALASELALKNLTKKSPNRNSNI